MEEERESLIEREGLQVEEERESLKTVKGREGLQMGEEKKDK